MNFPLSHFFFSLSYSAATVLAAVYAWVSVFNLQFAWMPSPVKEAVFSGQIQL